MKTSRSSFVLQDVGIVAMSFLVAIILVKTDTIGTILKSVEQFHQIGSLIAGMFFTSIFTTAPAIVALGELAKVNSVFSNALLGAVGAVLGDLVIFRFVRDRLSEHLTELIKHDSSWKRIKLLFRLKYFKWFTFLIGGLILASPFPDELAIGLFGVSKMKIPLFILVSFVFNFIGIFIIGTIATTL